MRLLSKMFATGLLTVTLAACGGPSDSPPGPLARHFDDMFVADVAMDQKAQMLQAQNDWSLAKAEQAKAESDYKSADAEVANVKNDQRAAQLAVDSANNNKKIADTSADNTKINDAVKNQHAAQVAKKAADERVKYYEAYRNWMKYQWRYTQENMYWREAQFELAKSSLAQKNNKSPRDVQYDWFPKQETERSSRTVKAKSKADSEKARATNARTAWLSAQAAADAENGRASNMPDPMAGK